ncbi:MAG TPA: polysaccharide pyruvyl transferase family protein [Streptosporangiaceae bacterium]|jgi:polysaccharide pyruvyl transferase WcaK-like protein
MMSRFPRRREARAVAAPRIGMFGLLGGGNIGNDGSLEALLAYLRTAHPGAILDTRCPGPRRVKAAHGIDGSLLQWYTRYANQTSGPAAVALKVAGKGIDVFRTAAWVRRHDAVIVPGAGILETTLPLRPWGVPYALFLACASGRLFGTKVALVSVGGNVINQRATRRLFISAARLASYRSFRDAQSRDAARRQGLDTSADPVYPDLVFGLPAPPSGPADPQTVGIGVMTYYGSNDDRRRAGQIHAAYMEQMKCFARWLLDNDHKIRLFTGDDVDESAVAEMVTDLRAYRPDLGPGWVVAEPVTSLTELMRQMALCGTIVATRYHNVLCALKLAKPTVSVGYAAKNDALMADMGLGEYCQSARALDVELLIKQFTELQNPAPGLRRAMLERGAGKARRLDEQFALLSRTLIGAAPAPRGQA